MGAKRGRKRTTENYFDVEEEAAVVRFLASTDDTERNEIYNTWLKPTFDKMIEAIIRKYKLYPKTETFKDVHTDTLSFLITKMDKFDVNAGKKAYSYYGTICKHYLLGLLIKEKKYSDHTTSYENVGDVVNSEGLSYTIEEDDFSMEEFIKRLILGIVTELNDDNLPPKKKLTDNEKKVGHALIYILDNWETAFNTMEGGPKYNKNSILETMRDYTNLSTKDIRLAMKRYKEMYELLKQIDL